MSDRKSAAGSFHHIEMLETRRLLSLGYGEAFGTVALNDFNSLISGGVTTSFTRYGDANLDGQITVADYNVLARNYGMTSGAKWETGDFTYDGVVNLSDFNRLATNFGLTAGPNGPTADDWAALANAVGAPPVPSATWTITDRGALLVTGTKMRDRIHIDEAALQRMRNEYPSIPIRRIHIEAGAGDDWIEVRVRLPATIVGDKGDDNITGGARGDNINGGSGHDIIFGSAGDDLINGAGGKDTVYSDQGNDTIFGGADDDYLNGGFDHDHLRGGTGNDELFGGMDDGYDMLCGDAGTDVLYGHLGSDRFKCADGEIDTIVTGGGRDRIVSQDDDDVHRVS
jgi:Ca2+-binding RTX toxin-like protein